MNGKKLMIWVIAHLVIASLVADEMRRRGKSNQDAQIAGHLAGGAAAIVLTAVL